MEEVRSDGLLGQVRLRIGDQRLTAVITGDAIEELKLRRGDEAVAIIKSTEVMIAREAELPAEPKRRAARGKRRQLDHDVQRRARTSPQRRRSYYLALLCDLCVRMSS